MPAAACPPTADLLAFHRGELTDEVANTLAGHVERCPRCEAALQALDGEVGTIAAALRQEPHDRPTVAFTPQPAEAAGSIIAGRYKLVEQIGEGGMGTVWMAQQIEPVKRLVAVKLVKAGMDSKTVLARFEAERQALALMDHPNIAKVLDAGSTDSGRPFFVMELVKGMPITKYCDDHKLTTRQRLELLVPVCQAVQHAHQKGVIHRDIKPSNVLAALYDGRPVPKVIDFGIAKATGQSLTDKTLITGFGAVIGTPEYMAPEQAELNQVDVDTRADVYALGVLLYELLTGSTPLTRQRLSKAALLEVLRLVREEEAPAPSTRLSTTEGLPGIAANRGTEPRRLAALLRGELDWVVMKALEKDRDRRYETANALARDLQRYLSDEPVEAGRPTARYRLWKLLRKHRRAAIMGTATVSVLAAFAGVAGWQAVRATRAQAGLVDALQRAETTTAFLTEAFQSTDPEKKGPDFKVVDLLADAAARLEADTAMEPRTRAKLRLTLVATYRGLGLAKTGLPLAERASAEVVERFGADDELALEFAFERALALVMTDKPADAVVVLADALKRSRPKFGDDHHLTLSAVNNLALALQMDNRLAEALPLFEQCHAARVRLLGADNKFTLTTLHNLALAYRADNRLDVALVHLADCLRRRRDTLGDDHPETLLSEQVLAQAYTAADRAADAVPLLESNLAAKQKRLGPKHRGTLNTTTILGSAYRGVGRQRDAIRQFEQSARLHLETQGADSPNTLTARNNLARSFLETGRPAEALPLLEDTVRRRSALRGADDENTLPPRRNVCKSLVDLGRPADAIHDLSAILAVYRAKGRLGVKNMLGTMLDLIEAYEAADRWADAEPLWEELLPAYTKLAPPDPPAHAMALEARGQSLLKRQRYEPAVTALRTALTVRPPERWQSALTKSRLGEALVALGRPDEAGPLLRAGYAGLCAATSEMAAKYRVEAVDRLIRFAEQTKDAAELAKWRAERAKYAAKP